jgi:hypothetical protein
MTNRTIARCKRCPQTPPWGFCPDCEAINRHRQETGLLKGADDETPSVCNALVPIVTGKYRGSRGYRDRLGRAGGHVVTACIEKKRGGWRTGVAKLDGRVIYRSAPQRGRTTVPALMAWATYHAEMIRIGLDYEAG